MSAPSARSGIQERKRRKVGKEENSFENLENKQDKAKVLRKGAAVINQDSRVKEGVILSIDPCEGREVHLPPLTRCVVPPTEYRDSYIPVPLTNYTSGQMIKCWFVEEVEKNGVKWNVFSCRKSRIGQGTAVDPIFDSTSQLSPGSRVRGIVTGLSGQAVTVSLSYKVTGQALQTDDDEDLELGRVVLVHINSIVDDSTVSVSLIPDEAISRSYAVKSSTHESAHGKVKPNRKSAVRLAQLTRRELRARQELDSKLFGRSAKPAPSKERTLILEEESFDLSETWDGFQPSPVVEATLQNVEAPPAKKAKSEIKKQQAQQEKDILEAENRLLDTSRSPESADDFDRLVAQSPDSSLVWLKYVSHHLELAEIEKARAVAERALQTINFREEKERFNVWAAYITLELSYGGGTEDRVEKLTERAVANCDAVRMLKHVATQLEQHDKLEKAEKTHKRLTRRYRDEAELWLEHAAFLYRQSRASDARALIARALTTVEKRHHVGLLFGHARHEWTYGDKELSRTMFENVLSTCPRRVDLWNVYIDLHVKAGDLPGARQILERSVTMDIAGKRIKSLLKKWLNLEKKHGDASTVQKVLDKAREIAEEGVDDE